MTRGLEMTVTSPGESVLAALRALMGESAVLTGADAAAFEHGARYGSGHALCVVQPTTVEQVCGIVRICAGAHVPLLTQGANTGLVGASTPDGSGRSVVLSTLRLRETLRVDAANRHVTASAGILLHELNEHLQEQGLCVPIDLAADPSVGGMVATNTGGTRLIKYGDVRHNLLAVEVVLFDPPGHRVRFGRPLRKDNTGLDLKQLFVGAAGATGIVTEATLVVHRAPRQSAVALVVPASDDAVLDLLLRLEARFGDFLAAFEGMSGTAMRAAVAHVPGLRNPFAPEPIADFAVLIELQASTSRAEGVLDLEASLTTFLESAYGDLISNAVVGKGDELWRLRHSISDGARALGKPVAFDISVPRSRMMAFRRLATEKVHGLSAEIEVVDFGHIADGGLHFNLAIPAGLAPDFGEERIAQVRRLVYDLAVQGFGGSFSAEHGVGPHNLGYYRLYTGATALGLSGQLQAVLDPFGVSHSAWLSPITHEGTP